MQPLQIKCKTWPSCSSTMFQLVLQPKFLLKHKYLTQVHLCHGCWLFHLMDRFSKTQTWGPGWKILKLTPLSCSEFIKFVSTCKVVCCLFIKTALVSDNHTPHIIHCSPAYSSKLTKTHFYKDNVDLFEGWHLQKRNTEKHCPSFWHELTRSMSESIGSRCDKRIFQTAYKQYPKVQRGLRFSP